MRILADVDTGIDDALALCWLAARPDVHLAAVTTSAGNTTAHQAAVNSAAVLAACGRPDVEVSPGTPAPLVVSLTTTPETHGAAGLGYAHVPASAALSRRPFLDVWLDEVRAHPGETTLLVTGPLTNLAVALRAEPRFPDLLGRVVIMGGAFDYPGNTTPTAEWNAWVDPDAAAETYRAFEGLPAGRLPIVCSLGVTEPVELRPAWLDALARDVGVPEPRLSSKRDRTRRVPGGGPDGGPTGGPDGGPAWFDLVADALRFYFEFHADYGYGYVASVHDLCAAMIAADAVPFEALTTWVGVETASELTRGTTVRDARHLWGRPANARVVTSVDPDAVLGAFRADLGRLPRRVGAAAQRASGPDASGSPAAAAPRAAW